MELERKPPSNRANESDLGPVNQGKYKDPIPSEWKFLARGAAADVWLVDSPDARGHKYAIKVIRINLDVLRENCNPRGPRNAEQLWNSFVETLHSKVQQWEKLRHDNIIGLFGMHEELGLRVEFCANGSASQFLDGHPYDHMEIRKRMVLDVLAGMGYLHSQNPPIVHGCICMDKILVDSQGKIKIAEFGLASLVEEFGLFAPSVSQAGRTRWLSPELLDADEEEDQNPTCTVASDIWALGCTLFEIISGNLPYFKVKHDLRVQQEILSKKHPGVLDNCLAPEFVDLWPILTQCWSDTPGQRPSCNTLAQSALSTLATSVGIRALKVGPEGVNLKGPQLLSNPAQAPPEKRRKVIQEPPVVWGGRSISSDIPKLEANDALPALAHAWTPDTNLFFPPPTPNHHLPLQITRRVSNFTKRSVNLNWRHPGKASGRARVAGYATSGSRPCERCRQLQMLCTFDLPEGTACRQCQTSGQDCTAQERELKPHKIVPSPPHQLPTENTYSKSQASEYEQWAVATAAGKRLRKETAKTGACKYCKRLMMKCTFDPGSATCQRCWASGRNCIVEGRTARRSSEPLEQLSALIDDKQNIIDGLLRVVSRSPAGEGPSPESAEVWRWVERAAQSLIPAPQAGEGHKARNEEKRLPPESTPLGLLADLSLNDPENEDNQIHGITGQGTMVGVSPLNPVTEGGGYGHRPSSASDILSHHNPPSSGTATILPDKLHSVEPTTRFMGGAFHDNARSGIPSLMEAGVANAEYFKPGPMADPELRRIIVERQMVPEILRSKVVTDDEVDYLFSIFHTGIDAIIGIADPVIHTADGVKSRCPFLFTVICTIAARYWVGRSELHTTLLHYAKSAAATAVIESWKSLEVCQAYLLLSIYHPPTSRWAEDRSWLYLGCAIRLAMDLQLHELGPTTYLNEMHERDSLNRKRTWLICFNMDRELATRLGRPTTISENNITRHSREWWRHSNYNSPQDLHLCYNTQLLLIVSRYFSIIYSDPESLTGFNWDTDFEPIIRAFDEEMEQFMQDMKYTHALSPEATHPSCQYRLSQITLQAYTSDKTATTYYRLVISSLGLEHALKSASVPGSGVFNRFIDAASEIVHIVNEDLERYELHKYSPVGYWIWSIYAAMVLIKLAKPRSTKPSHFTLTGAQREAAISLVSRLIRALQSSDTDVERSPALYAHALARMLAEPSLSTVEGAKESQHPDKDIIWFSLSMNEPNHGETPPGMAAERVDFWDNLLLPGTWGLWHP